MPPPTITVVSPGFLDVRLDNSNVRYLIFTGIAIPTYHGEHEEVVVDLGVDVTEILQYTATVGLASISNDDSGFVFATDEVWIETPDGHLFLHAKLSAQGDSTLHRFSYQAHVKVIVSEPLISGTIRWAQGLETHTRSSGLFSVSANLLHQVPGGVIPTFEKVADGQVGVAQLGGQDYEASYFLPDVPLREDLYVIAEIVPGAFSPSGDLSLRIEADTPGVAPAAGPFNLTGIKPTASGVDFHMVGSSPPK